MRAFLVLVLLAAVADAETPRFKRFTTRTPQGRNQRGLLANSLAFFEAFPASGAGTSGPCSTTPPTGARGEVLTFTRASSATCTKTATGGLATTGIANGDLVSLSSNVARVEYDSAGVLGLLVEAASTNLCLRSDEIDNAVWTKESSGAANTITANAATAPDNTATADRFQGIATSGAGFADIYQVWAAGAIADPTACSAYVRGNALSDTTDICAYDGASWGCTACVYVSASWSRCIHTDAAGSGSTTRMCKLGNNSNQNGGVARNALDAFTWCLQGESKAYATSCINTTSAAVTRVIETMKVNGATFPTTTFSKAVTVTVPWATATAPATWSILVGEVGVASGSDMYGVSNSMRTQNCSGACTNVTTGALTIPALTTVRFAASQSAGLANIYQDAVLRAGPSALTAPASPWNSATGIADNTAGLGHLDGIISRICIDANPARCR